MEREVPFIMEEVCAIPQNPPNAVKTIARTYLTENGSVDAASRWIPLVISVRFTSNSLQSHGRGRLQIRVMTIEKSMMSPPILTSASKPFIMLASMILKFI